VGNMGYGGNEVKATGGFANLKIKPWKNAWFNIMAGVDDPEDDNLAIGEIIKNEKGSANVYYSWVDGKVITSLEVGVMNTYYKTAGPEDKRQGIHYQFTVFVPFG
ncbi:MAG TPA: hypothetical protein VMW66_03775, partial [Elusimicrobiales bacterium]|nr:hypothetical protein [Elusimicrobiales bacterium]